MFFKKVLKKKFFLLYVFSFFVFVSEVSAQISFSPEMLVLDISNKEIVKKSITIRNEGATNKEFIVSIDFRRKGECSLPIDEFVSFSPKQFSLKPTETKEIYIKVKGFGQKISGESVLGLFIAEKIAKPLSMEIRTGTPIFIRWNREQRISGEIEKVDYEIIENDELLIDVKVKNTGQTHIAPYGIVWLEKKGKRIWQAELKPTQPIFPSETKSLTWKGQIPKLTKQSRTELNALLFWGTLYGIESVGKPGMASAKKEMKF